MPHLAKVILFQVVVFKFMAISRWHIKNGICSKLKLALFSLKFSHKTNHDDIKMEKNKISKKCQFRTSHKKTNIFQIFQF